MQTGEHFIVFSDGSNDNVVEIKNIDKHRIILTTTETHPVRQTSRNMIAVISMVKGGAFETIVQKLTELGVSTIVPLTSDRTVKQSVRLDRLQSISDEALEQSGGTKRVSIVEPIGLEDCLEKYKYPSILFDMEAPALQKQNSDTIVMYIGPEGGWSDKDKELFKKYNVAFANLGPRVLRADTAAIVGAFTLLQ